MQNLNITLDDAICKDCNTVWLNRELERPLQPILAPMADRARPTVLSLARLSLIATWAVKAVLLFELAIRQKCRARGRSLAITPHPRNWPGYASTRNLHHGHSFGSAAGIACARRRSCTRHRAHRCRRGMAR
jgi:hypothetical protein